MAALRQGMPRYISSEISRGRVRLMHASAYEAGFGSSTPSSWRPSMHSSGNSGRTGQRSLTSSSHARLKRSRVYPRHVPNTSQPLGIGGYLASRQGCYSRVQGTGVRLCTASYCACPPRSPHAYALRVFVPTSQLRPASLTLLGSAQVARNAHYPTLLATNEPRPFSSADAHHFVINGDPYPGDGRGSGRGKRTSPC